MQGEIARPDDSDYFKLAFNQRVRDRVVVKLENRSETLRPHLTLFGPDRAQLDQQYSYTAGANIELAFSAEPGATYYLKVDPYSTSGAYTLAAKPQQAYDRFEPNNDPVRNPPTALAIGRAVDASILDQHDPDWYVLTGAPTNKLRLRFENRSTTLKPNVVIYNAQRVQIQNPYEHTAGASLDFSFDATPGTAYYFQVQPTGAGAYRLTLN